MDAFAGWFSLDELAALLGLTRNALNHYVVRGKLVGRKVGHARLFRLVDVERAGVKVPYRAPAE